MRRRRIIGLLLLLCGIGAATAVGLHYWRVAREARYQELRNLAHELHTGIERYAVYNQGDFPPDLETMLRKENLELPNNPFGRGKVRILKPTDPWEPGGVVYVAWGPTIETSFGTVRTVAHYILVAYSSRLHQGQEHEVQELYVGQSSEPNEKLPAITSEIDWEHAEVVKVPWQVHRPGSLGRFPPDY